MRATYRGTGHSEEIELGARLIQRPKGTASRRVRPLAIGMNAPPEHDRRPPSTMEPLSVRATACALALLTAGPVAAAVICVDPADSACQATIQAGVDAAAAGDTVRVAPGLYLERVTIGTAGVQLSGAKGVVIDASGLSSPADAVTVLADDVALEGLSIANGDAAAISVNGAARTRIEGIEVVSPDGFCVQLIGPTPDVVIERSRLRFCGDRALEAEDADGLRLLDNAVEGGRGVDVTADRVRAEGNEFTRSDGPFFVEGDDASVTGNRFVLCDGAVSVEGRSAVVSQNEAESVGRGIRAFGDDVVVVDNRLAGIAGDGIRAACDGDCGAARVAGNRVTSAGDFGIFVEAAAPGLTVERNRIIQTVSSGIRAEQTVGAQVVRNLVAGAGVALARCAELQGDAITMIGNQLSGCAADGIEIEGNGNRAERNRIAETGDDGVDVEAGDGNAVVANRIDGASDNGIEVSAGASATLVSENRATGVRASYCDGGTGTTGADAPDATAGCGDVDD